MASLQLGIISQKYFYSQADVESWWTEEELQSDLNKLSEEQESHFKEWRRSGWRALACYNAGIGVLAAALATLLAPLPTDDCTLAGTKWAAVALLSIAGALVLWFGIVTAAQVRGI
ncbi:hypothetical protein [Streptomyces sp. NPDC012616]|uniref:hypothetical protein n=1 Tax=Streptomyces sp. NPDC012616 TaxID=3364840 RepID=UPI0036E16DF0